MLKTYAEPAPADTMPIEASMMATRVGAIFNVMVGGRFYTTLQALDILGEFMAEADALCNAAEPQRIRIVIETLARVLRQDSTSNAACWVQALTMPALVAFVCEVAGNMAEATTDAAIRYLAAVEVDRQVIPTESAYNPFIVRLVRAGGQNVAI